MRMSEFNIVDNEYTREYSSEKFPNATLIVKVVDFFPCLNSWEYSPPFMGETFIPDQEKREYPARFYGKDILKCIVGLRKESGETLWKNASIVRSISPGGRLGDAKITWRTSCISKSQSGVYTHGDEVVYDSLKSKHESLWELSSPDSISHENQINRLLNNAERLFETGMRTKL